MDTLKTIENIAPQRRKMSYEAYLGVARDTQIVEWVDGEVINYFREGFESQLRKS